jgi:transposase
MQNICGVDVSKLTLDAAIRPGGQSQSFANDAEGIAGLASWCKEHGVELAVMEASGGYERRAFLLLWELEVPCAVVNATQVRRFAEAMGFLEKTDGIDAPVIAHFAQAKEIKAKQPPSLKHQRLQALVRRLGQVTGDLCVQQQRLKTAGNDEVQASIAETIAFFRGQAKKLEGEIASAIDDDPLWAKLAQAFTTIKGVGSRTVARLMADLPEIGVLSNKAIAKLTGLAPFAKDSGQYKGKRQIRAGRATVRSILYLVADIARRFDPSLQEFHHRLKQAGKPKMVIRIALAHKLLVRLNAKARDARAELANAT